MIQFTNSNNKKWPPLIQLSDRNTQIIRFFFSIFVRELSDNDSFSLILYIFFGEKNQRYLNYVRCEHIYEVQSIQLTGAAHMLPPPIQFDERFDVLKSTHISPSQTSQTMIIKIKIYFINFYGFAQRPCTHVWCVRVCVSVCRAETYQLLSHQMRRPTIIITILVVRAAGDVRAE